MATTKELGKIESIKFGYGGYQEALIGLSIIFKGDGFGISDFKGDWAPSIIECSQNAKWSEEDRSKHFDELVRYIDKLLKDAKKQYLHQLNGVPVELTLESGTLKSWRILTEVL